MASRLKLPIVLLLLLTIAGQSLAALNAPCAEMQDHDHASMHANMPSGMDAHAGMQHDHHQPPASAACDCCDHALCAMVHCTPAPAAMIDYRVAEATPLARVFTARLPAPYLAADKAAPYRPPILR